MITWLNVVCTPHFHVLDLFDTPTLCCKACNGISGDLIVHLAFQGLPKNCQTSRSPNVAVWPANVAVLSPNVAVGFLLKNIVVGKNSFLVTCMSKAVLVCTNLLENWYRLHWTLWRKVQGLWEAFPKVIGDSQASAPPNVPYGVFKLRVLEGAPLRRVQQVWERCDGIHLGESSWG